MCGIIGFISNKDVFRKAIDSLLDIEYRGYDSWGIAYYNKEIKLYKEIGFINKNIKQQKTKCIIGHTRWATHGGVTKENAHPHLSNDGKLALVHNGIIENYTSLKSKLDVEFKSQTDSEVVIHLISSYKDLDIKSALSSSFKEIEGCNSLVLTDGSKIIACKNGSPLVVGKLKDGFMIASDSNCILKYTNDLLFLEDNDLVEFNSKEISLFDVFSLSKKSQEWKKVDWEYSSVKNTKYKYYMEKEIKEQPVVLKKTFDNFNKDYVNVIRNAFGTYFIGCGSASYACLAGTYLFSKIAKKHVNFSVASEFSYIEDYITKDSLLIPVSQSGETMDIIDAVNSAKSKGAKICSITNTLGSSLYRKSNESILLGVGIEKAVCATKTFTSMVANIMLLAYSIINDKEKAIEIINNSIKDISRIIKDKKIYELSTLIKDKKDIYVLGRGLSYPISLETALKIKEICYIHAEGFAGGELKHGVMALIEKDVPVIVFAPNDETYNSIISNAIEVKARGAYVVGVSNKNNEVFDYWIEAKDVGCSSILNNIVIGQLLAYYISINKGINPDKPRNLAKSVVVR